MNVGLKLLGGLLALQLVLVAVLLFADSGLRGGDQAAFLDLDASEIDGLDVFDSEGNSVRLRRDADGWRAAAPTAEAAGGSAELPADDAKVAEVLQKLLEIRAQWPVGTTEETRERFEVTEAKFQRKVSLLSGDTAAAEVYLGTSPGYRRVHARLADADEVYSIDFANYQLPAQLNDWLDKTVLAARGDVSEVTKDGAWLLSRDGEGWSLNGGPADQEAAAQLVGRFDDLRVTGLAPQEAGDGTAGGDSANVAEFTVVDDEGAYQLRLSRSDGDAEYVVTTDRRDGRFTIAAYVAEQLLLSADDLTPDAGDSEDEAGEPGAAK